MKEQIVDRNVLIGFEGDLAYDIWISFLRIRDMVSKVKKRRLIVTGSSPVRGTMKINL